MSDVLTVSNGFPQGCVLSPVLFSIFTNEFTINEEHFWLFKYADEWGYGPGWSVGQNKPYVWSGLPDTH